MSAYAAYHADAMSRYETLVSRGKCLAQHFMSSEYIGDNNQICVVGPDFYVKNELDYIQFKLPGEQILLIDHLNTTRSFYIDFCGFDVLLHFVARHLEAPLKRESLIIVDDCYFTDSTDADIIDRRRREYLQVLSSKHEMLSKYKKRLNEIDAQLKISTPRVLRRFTTNIRSFPTKKGKFSFGYEHLLVNYPKGQCVLRKWESPITFRQHLIPQPVFLPGKMFPPGRNIIWDNDHAFIAQEEYDDSIVANASLGPFSSLIESITSGDAAQVWDVLPRPIKIMLITNYLNSFFSLISNIVSIATSTPGTNRISAGVALAATLTNLTVSLWSISSMLHQSPGIDSSSSTSLWSYVSHIVGVIKTFIMDMVVKIMVKIAKPSEPTIMDDFHNIRFPYGNFDLTANAGELSSPDLTPEETTNFLPWLKLGTIIITLIGSLVCGFHAINSENKKQWDFVSNIGRHLSNSMSTTKAIFGDDVSIIGLLTNIFGEVKCSDSMKIRLVVDEISALLAMPIRELKSVDGKVQRLFALPEEVARLLETVKTNRSNNAAVRSLSGLLVTMYSSLLNRIQEVKMLEGARTRPDPIACLLVGKRAVGKTAFSTYITRKLTDIMAYKCQKPYQLNKSPEAKYFNTYLGEEIAYVDEFLFDVEKDSILPAFNNIFASAPYTIQGASLSEKKQNFESRIVLMTSNIEDKNILSSKPASIANAIWSRILWVQVEDPLVESSENVRFQDFAHRQPDFSHLELTIKTHKGINEFGKATKVSPMELIDYLAEQLVKREIKYLDDMLTDFGPRLPAIDADDFRLRRKYLEGFENTFETWISPENGIPIVNEVPEEVIIAENIRVQRDRNGRVLKSTYTKTEAFAEERRLRLLKRREEIEAREAHLRSIDPFAHLEDDEITANAGGRDFCVFRFQGKAGAGKSTYVSALVSRLSPIIGYPVHHVIDDEEFKQIDENPSAKIFVIDDMLTQRTLDDYLRWINASHPKSIFFIVTNEIHELHYDWTRSIFNKICTTGLWGRAPLQNLVVKNGYYRIPDLYYGFIRRLGLPGLHWMSDDSWELADMRFAACITQSPGVFTLDGNPSSPSEIDETIYRKTNFFLKSSHGVPVLRTPAPPSTYQVKIIATSINHLTTVLKSKSTIMKTLVGQNKDVSFNIQGDLSGATGKVDPESFVMNMDIKNEAEIEYALVSMLSRLVRIKSGINVAIHCGDQTFQLVDNIIYMPPVQDNAEEYRILNHEVLTTVPFLEGQYTLSSPCGQHVIKGQDILRVLASDVVNTDLSLNQIETIRSVLIDDDRISPNWIPLLAENYYNITKQEAIVDIEVAQGNSIIWPIVVSLISGLALLGTGYMLYKNFFPSVPQNVTVNQMVKDFGNIPSKIFPSMTHSEVIKEALSKLHLTEYDFHYWNCEEHYFDLERLLSIHEVYGPPRPNGKRHPKSTRTQRFSDEEYDNYLRFLTMVDKQPDITPNEKGKNKSGRGANRRRMTAQEYRDYLDLLEKLDADPKKAFEFAQMNKHSYGVSVAMGWDHETMYHGTIKGQWRMKFDPEANSKPSAKNGKHKYVDESGTYSKTGQPIIEIQGKDHKDLDTAGAKTHSHICHICKERYTHRHTKVKQHELECPKCHHAKVEVTTNSIRTVDPVSRNNDLTMDFARKIEKNIVKVESMGAACHAMMLYNHVGVTVAHIIPMNETKLQVTFDLDGKPARFDATVVMMDRKRDMCIFELLNAKHVPMFCKLKTFVDNVMDQEPINGAFIQYFTDGSPKATVGAVRCFKNSRTPIAPEQNYFAAENQSIMIPSGFSTVSTFVRRGDCGLPLITIENNVPKILGFHNAYSEKTCRLYFTYITTADFEHVQNYLEKPLVQPNSTGDLVKRTSAFGDEIYMTPVLAQLTENLVRDGFQHEGIHCMGANYRLRDPINTTPHKVYLGDENLRFKCTSSFAPHIVEDVPDTSKLYFNSLKGRHSIGFSQLKKYGETLPGAAPLNEQCYKAAEAYMMWYYKERYGEIKILTPSQVVNGIRNPNAEVFKYSSGIDMNTSAGLVFGKVFKATTKGDVFENKAKEGQQPFYVPADNAAGRYYQETLDAYWKALGEGKICVSGAKACLKQEILPLEKCNTGGTRLFQAVDVDRIVLRGRLTRQLMWTQFARREKCVARGGANIYVEATQMRDFLEEIQGTDLFGDFSRFDKYLPRRCAESFGYLRYHLLPKEDQNQENLNRMIAESIGQLNSIQLMDGSFFMVNRGNLSGQADTLPINDYCNHLSFIYCLYRRLLDQGKDIEEFTVHEIYDMYRLITTGDDNWSRFVPELEMTFEVIEKYFAEFGLLFTASNKGLSDDETFCSRTMNRDKKTNIVFPALKKTSIERLLHFTVDLDPAQLAANFRGCLLEAALWDKTYYDQIMEDINQQLKNLDQTYNGLGQEVRRRLSFTSYKVMRRNWERYIRGMDRFPEISPLGTAIEIEVDSFSNSDFHSNLYSKLTE